MIEHCWHSIMYHRCTPPLLMEETLDCMTETKNVVGWNVLDRVDPWLSGHLWPQVLESAG